MSAAVHPIEPDDGYVLYVDIQLGDPGPIEPLGRYSTLAVSLPAVGDWVDTGGNAGYQVVSRVWELGDDEVCCRLIVIGGGS